MSYVFLGSSLFQTCPLPSSTTRNTVDAVASSCIGHYRYDDLSTAKEVVFSLTKLLCNTRTSCHYYPPPLRRLEDALSPGTRERCCHGVSDFILKERLPKRRRLLPPWLDCHLIRPTTITFISSVHTESRRLSGHILPPAAFNGSTVPPPPSPLYTNIFRFKESPPVATSGEDTPRATPALEWGKVIWSVLYDALVIILHQYFSLAHIPYARNIRLENVIQDCTKYAFQ